MTKLLTIGQLARQAGLRPSALRFYEAEGLLEPREHTAAGYRLYDEAAATTLAFIQRAQRLGFSLADIGALLGAQRAGTIDDAELIRVAEARYLALERQITPLLVLQHELGHLLSDMRGPARPPGDAAARMIDRVCADPLTRTTESTLDWLIAYAGCRLNSDEGRRLLAGLRGRHVHIWQDGEAYQILLVGDEPGTGELLAGLARLEAGCQPDEQARPEVRPVAEGQLFVARGPHAFLFARLFLALEHGDGAAGV